uniref:Single-stranded DNA-binding protein n=1 Tax=Roseihalotalea indica TaxID=2867963 RepID=A0AA49JEX4_9BACT|nr:single-stranded DNA-binding protein [Tunicatimonas sp. TK19036]
MSNTQETKLFADTNITMKSGHLVRDCEVIGEGRYAKLRIASNKQYAGENGEVLTQTNYFDALVSKNLKEAFDTAIALKKGDWVYLKGEDSTRSFDTPEGYKQTASTIFAYKVALKKKADSTESQSEAQAAPGMN